MPDFRKKDKTTTQKGGTTKTVKAGENVAKIKTTTVAKGTAETPGDYMLTKTKTKRKVKDNSHTVNKKTKTKVISAKRAKRIIKRGTKKAIKSKAKMDIAMSNYNASNDSKPKLKRGGHLTQHD
tara:strand:+ start:1112 stop:1483 length:372 start_codon:yes stop_codon:yes gene_type:complete